MDVKNFKFKCFRQIIQRDAQSGERVINLTKLFAFKEPGCAAHKNTIREFVFDIPLSCKQDGDAVPPLPCSWHGEIFSVDYYIQVYVKHLAWNSLGQGDSV